MIGQIVTAQTTPASAMTFPTGNTDNGNSTASILVLLSGVRET